MKKLLLFFLSVFIPAIGIYAQSVTSISFYTDTVRVNVGDSTTVKIKVQPDPFTKGSIEWWSEENTSFDTVRTVNDTICVIRGLKADTTALYVKSSSGKTVSVPVVVSFIHVDSIRLSSDTIKMYVNDSATVVARFFPDSVSNDSVTWTSSDPAIVSVESVNQDSIGKIKALSEGTVKIYAVSKDNNEQKDSCEVEVHKVDVGALTLNRDTVYLPVNRKATLTASFTPANVTDKSVVWTSSDSTVVDFVTANVSDTVNNIKTLKNDTAIIYATSQDDATKYDSCVIIVNTILIDSISLNVHSVELGIGDMQELDARLFPVSRDLVDLIWTSTDPSVISIKSITHDSICYVKALKAGEAKIFVKSDEGEGIDSCYFKVNPKFVDGIRIAEDVYRINVDSTTNIIAKVYPSNASNDSIVWTSSDSSIVDITATSFDSICVVKGLDLGSATIYATTKDGGFKDSCTVYVDSIHVTGLIIEQDSVVVYIDSVYTINAILSPAGATEDSIIWRIDGIEMYDVQYLGHKIEIKAITEGRNIIKATSFEGAYSDSCVVISKKRSLLIVSDTTASNTGIIDMFVKVPENATFGILFKIHMPYDFKLIRDSIKLSDEYKDNTDISVTLEPNNVWLVRIENKLPVDPNSTINSLRKIVSLAYTLINGTTVDPANTYDVSISDFVITFSDGTEIKESAENIKIKEYISPTGNDVITDLKVSAYVYKNSLYVDSDINETINVYSLIGQLLLTKQKPAGHFVLPLNVQDKVLVIKGSSGWTIKVIN